jgi:hypothetical protein
MSLRKKNQPTSATAQWFPILATSAIVLLACWGIYGHRENLEVERKRQIETLKTEVTQLRDKRDTLRRELNGRLRPEVLQEALRHKNLPLQRIQDHQTIDTSLAKKETTNTRNSH